jgi:hypothetical protein
MHHDHDHALTARLRALRSDERGGVVLVVILMTVASMLVLVTVSNVSSGLSRASDDQTRANAFQHANAGIDQALHRIEKRPLPTSVINAGKTVYTPTVVDGKVTAFTEVFDDDDGTRYEIKATQTPPGQDTVWRVNSTGRDPSTKLRQAVANIRATPLFENGMFTTNTFYITGNQFNDTTPTAYNSLLCPNPSTANAVPPPNDADPCNLSHPVQARLGSNIGFPVNSPASLRAMVDQWAGFAVYGQATIEGALELCGNNTKCHTVTSSDGTRTGNVVNVAEPLKVKMPSITGPCPNRGRLGSAVKPAVSTIAAGDYRCANLTIQGTLNVTGTGNVRFYVDNELSVVPGKGNQATRVNAGQRPVRFQLYLPEQPAGTTNNSQICGSQIYGLLYVPGMDIRCHGSGQTEIFGAVVARSYSGTGNHFAFHWDATSATVLHNGEYRVFNWRECPVGEVDC